MSKPMKNVLMRDYKARVGGHADPGFGAMLIGIRGVKGIQTTAIRNGLARKSIRITVVRNALAREAFKDSGLAQLVDLLTGSNALAYGGSSVIEVAREIVGLVAKFPAIELKGAVFDGTLFKASRRRGTQQVPTREAQAWSSR